MGYSGAKDGRGGQKKRERRKVNGKRKVRKHMINFGGNSEIAKLE